MKDVPSDIYPPTTIAGRPRSRPPRGSGIAAVVVLVLAIGAVIGYSAAELAPSHPTPTSVQPQAPFTHTDYSAQSTNNGPGGPVQLPDKTTALRAEADLRIDAEGRLGIDLDDFEPAAQEFLIALSTVGTDVRAVSHVTHP